MDFSNVSVNFNLPSGLIGNSALKFTIALPPAKATSMFAIPTQSFKNMTGWKKLALEVSMSLSLIGKKYHHTQVSFFSGTYKRKNQSIKDLRDYSIVKPWP